MLTGAHNRWRRTHSISQLLDHDGKASFGKARANNTYSAMTLRFGAEANYDVPNKIVRLTSSRMMAQYNDQAAQRFRKSQILKTQALPGMQSAGINNDATCKKTCSRFGKPEKPIRNPALLRLYLLKQEDTAQSAFMYPLSTVFRTQQHSASLRCVQTNPQQSPPPSMEE